MVNRAGGQTVRGFPALARRLLATAAIALGSTLAALTAAEVAVRVVAPAHAGIIETDSARFFRYVAGGIKVYPAYGVSPPNPTLVEIGAHGYRGPEPGPRSARPRLVVFGDSYVAGEFLPYSRTYGEELARALGTGIGEAVEVVPAAVPGYGPWQELLSMQADLPRFAPDAAVLVLLADNDFGDLVRDRRVRVRADSLIDWRPVRLTDSLRTAIEGAAHPAGLDRLHLMRWLRRALEKRPNAIPRGLDQRAVAVQRLYRGPLSAGLMTNDELDFARFQAAGDAPAGGEIFGDHYALSMALPDSPMSDTALHLMRVVLDEARRTAAARQVPLLTLVVPSAIDACTRYDRMIDTVRFPAYDRRLHSRRLVSVARAAGLVVVDLWDAFQADDACTLYFPRINHWNAEGAARAARVSADSLLARGFVRRSAGAQ
ncbi:MAG: SGNH/GDSL hydrolase family protein [Gemmatimonadetes bacterium]|nr:SGNH/GDSL hydrolase family protein [Gemmatimonadota bacterium]